MSNNTMEYNKNLILGEKRKSGKKHHLPNAYYSE